MSMNELEAKVAELRELRRMADELAGEIAATEDALKAYMTENGTDELYGPSFKITWREVTSSRRTRHGKDRTQKRISGEDRVDPGLGRRNEKPRRRRAGCRAARHPAPRL